MPGYWVLVSGQWKRAGRTSEGTTSTGALERPTGPGIYALEDLGVGTDVNAALSKVATLAAGVDPLDGKTRRTLTLPAMTVHATGFAKANNYAGFLVPNGVGIVGSGPGQTIFQVDPDTITSAQVSSWYPADVAGNTNGLKVFVAANGSDVRFGQFTIRGTQQRVGGTGVPSGYDTYQYNGAFFYKMTRPLIHDLKITGIPGYKNEPPGETSALGLFIGDGAKLYRCEVDGRRDLDNAKITAAGIATNNNTNVYLEGCSAHHNGFSHGFAFWQTNGITAVDCSATNNGTTGSPGTVADGFNFERSRTTVLTRPTVGFNTLCELRYYGKNNNDAYDGDTYPHSVDSLTLTDGGALDINIDGIQTTLPTITNSPTPVYH